MVDPGGRGRVVQDGNAYNGGLDKARDRIVPDAVD